MKTWNDYKEHVKRTDAVIANDINEIEELSSIVSAIITQRNSLGLTQRELAEKCNLPQSSIARIETFKSVPKLDTLLKLMSKLGLRLQVASAAM